MAEIISIHVKLASGSYQSIEKIDNLWKTVQKLNSTPITLSIETKAIDSATKKMLALATAQAKAEAEAWKAEQADIKRAAASEARAAKEAAAAEKRANAEKQAQDKKTQAMIEAARKAEDLADKEAKRKEQELIHMKKLILQEQQAYEKAQEAEAAAAAKAEQKKAAEAEKRRVAEYQAAEKHRQDQIKRDQQAAAEAERSAQRQAAAQEKAAGSIDTLRKNYANLLRQIENLKAKYPEGTFDDIEREAREAGEEVRHLDANSKTLVGDVDRLSGTYKKLNADLAQTKAEHQAEANSMKENTAASTLLNNSLGNLVLQYMSLRMIISKVVSAFRDALNTMKEVDSELVTIQKTTGYSGERLDRLTDSAYKLASAYGRTATEILGAASVYARAGFKENLEDMTELSALLQNVGDLSGEAAAKFLVATNAAWQMNGSYDALLRVIDGLNQQTNEAAVDMDALTSGITVAGSVFSNAGESVQTFAGLLGAGVALTQRSGSEIGRGLRTIAMNIRQIKGELDDGEIIDEASISNAAAALHSVGISVADANGELRLTSDVLTDLAAKWGSLTTAEQSYLSQSLAGKRQANILNALMNNWQEVERQMTLYANGAGSAMKENEIYLDSWEAKTKQLDAAWTEFVANLVDTDMIKGALDGVIGVIQFLDTEVGRGLVVALAVPSAIFAIVAVVAKLKAAIAALNVTMLSNPVFLAIAAGTLSIYGIVRLVDALTTSTAEYAEAAEKAKEEYNEIQTQITELKAREEELTDLERRKLELLEKQAEVAKEQAKSAALDLYYNGDDNGVVAGTPYERKYGELQQSLERASRAEGKEIEEQMRELERLSKAYNLIAEYKKLIKEISVADSTTELNSLKKSANDTMSELLELTDSLREFADTLGDEMPEEGKKTLQILEDFILSADKVETKSKALADGQLSLMANTDAANQMAKVFGVTLVNNNTLLEQATEKTENSAEAVNKLGERLKSLSDKATSFDTVISAVVSAIKEFGEGSYEVYHAMQNLESIIPGSTDKLYDFDTATLLTKEDIWGSKDALLDFIDTQKQLEFSSAISELEAVAAAYWDVAGAALAAMTNQQAAAQMAGVLAFTTTGSSSIDTLDSQMAAVKQSKSEWDAYVATLRARSSYQPDSGSSGRSGYTPVSSAPENTKDPELERLKAIVSLEKAELSFLQASGKSLDEINAKRKVIQAALHDEAEYLRGQLEILKAEEVAEEDKAEHEAKIKALEEDILGLSTEWWNIQKNINDDLAKAEEERLKKLEEEKKLLEEQKKLQQEMFDTLKKQVDEYYDKLVADKEKELTLEERILAVQQAEAALANAQKERTVRYYNAATGQWEWQANAKNVKSAQDALKKAQDDLNKYQREQAWKEFKSAWEYVTEQIKAGAMTFKEAYDYMYDAMTRIQDTYGVDLGYVLEDSIGGFKDLNYGIDGLTQEVANSLGASVGVLDEKLKQYETAVGAFKDAFDEASEKIKNGEWTMEDAYSYLRDRAKEIADKYGIDMTGALEEAIAGMDKTNMSIDELWKSVIINLMKVNSARWFDANDEEKKMLHAQNEYLGRLIGATYDPSGYWYLNGSQLYGSQKGVDYSGKTTGYGNFTGSGGGYGISSGGGGGGGSGGGSGGSTGGIGSRKDANGNWVYYDSYGNTYATLEEAVAGNAANAQMRNASRGKVYYGSLITSNPAMQENRWTDPEAWAAYSKLTEADPEYAAMLSEMEAAAAGGASLEELTAMKNALYSEFGKGSFGAYQGEGGTTGFVKAGYGNANGEHLLILNGKLYETGVDAGTMLQDLWGNRWEVGADGHTLTPMDRAWEAMTDLDNNDLTMAGANAMRDTTAPAPAPVASKNVTNNRGDTYNLGGISIGEQAAKTTTVFELARMAGQLGQYKGAV